MATSTVKRGEIHVASGNVLLADVNAGYVIMPPNPTRTITVVGGYLQAIGGAATACTSIDVKDTSGSPVVAVVCGQAALSQNTVLQFNAAAGVTWTTRTALTQGKGLQVQTTGVACTTATSFNYEVQFYFD